MGLTKDCHSILIFQAFAKWNAATLSRTLAFAFIIRGMGLEFRGRFDV
jgi:hypothetical protein